MVFKIASVDSLVIYFEDEISLEVSAKVKVVYEQIKSLDAIIEIVPSYNSILITYDIFTYDFETLVELIKKSTKKSTLTKDTNSKLFEIPVYYGLEVGLDLERLSNYSKLSVEDVINLHSSIEYNVFAIGFAPGFAYLGNVDKKIAMNRLETPRKKVPKGSVAITNEQTAIYPNESAGGWNIVGRTTFNLYDKNLKDLTPLSMGDRIKFNPISKDEFLKSGGVL